MVTNRWRPSRDGKWLWKGDTSSDEITGHMYGYLIYYDLIVRHDKKEAKRVSDHVCRIMDYIMDGGLQSFRYRWQTHKMGVFGHRSA